jgi:hypothetical protein
MLVTEGVSAVVATIREVASSVLLLLLLLLLLTVIPRILLFVAHCCCHPVSRSQQSALHCPGNALLMNGVLRRIFGPVREEVTGGWRRLHNEEHHNLYASPDIVWMLKSR